MRFWRIGQIQEMLRAWTAFVHRWAAYVVSVCLAVSVGFAVFSWNHLTINTDTAEMIDPSLPFRQDYIRYKEAFPQFVDNLAIVIEADLPEVADAATRQFVAALADRPDQFNAVFAPEIDPFFRRHGLLFMDGEELSTLLDRLADSQALLSTLARDPTLRGLFEVLTEALEESADDDHAAHELDRVFRRLMPIIAASLDARPRYLSWRNLVDDKESAETEWAERRVILTQPSIDFSTLQPASRALAMVREIARGIEAEADGNLRIRLTGKAALATEELSSVAKGAALAGVLSFILVALVLAFGVRSARLVAAILITLLAGLVWTGFFATITIGSLNMISVAFAVLFIGLGADFGIHYALRYREEREHHGDRLTALTETARGVGLALALCTPTTALAFYAFVPTAYAGLAQLGLISGTGMFIALFLSLTLLPALLAIMPARAMRPLKAAALLPKNSSQLPKRAVPILVVTALFAGAAALWVSDARFDADPMNLRDPNTESVQTFYDLLRDSETSPYSLQLLTPSLDAARATVERIEALDLVDSTVSLARFVPSEQSEKLAALDDASFFMLPVLDAGTPRPEPDFDEQVAALENFLTALEAYRAAPPDGAAAATLAGLEELLMRFQQRVAQEPDVLVTLEHSLLRYFPAMLDDLRTSFSAGEVDIDTLPERLRSRYVSANGLQRVEVFPRSGMQDPRALEDFVEAVRSIEPHATGAPAELIGSGRVVSQSIIQASLGAAVLIVIILSVTLRSVRNVILVILPLVLAALLTVAATVIIGMPFNFANVIVLPLLIGLGVDGGIHLVLRGRIEGRAGTMLESSTPRAVLLSALTTLGAFGTLALSSHRGTASMGQLLVIAIVMILLSTLVVLPALLTVVERLEARGRGG